jgi:hypothetical protein
VAKTLTSHPGNFQVAKIEPPVGVDAEISLISQLLGVSLLYYGWTFIWRRRR